MRFIRNFASVMSLILAMICGLIVDLHPWAAILCVGMAIVFAWIGAQDPPAPPLHQRHYKWEDRDHP